jgi:hypothetical protein
MERIGYRLGTLLGLPVPETYLETYDGDLCCIQRRVIECVSFRQLGLLAMRANVSNASLYAKAALFDVLLANIDRRDVNLLFEPVGGKCSKALKCRFWLIDHGHCGLWPAVKFMPDGDPVAMPTDPGQIDGLLHPRAEQIIRELMPDPYRAALVHASGDHLSALLDDIRQVVDDGAIDTAVQEVPEQFMEGNLRAATGALFKTRRDRLDEVLDRYWQP